VNYLTSSRLGESWGSSEKSLRKCNMIGSTDEKMFPKNRKLKERGGGDSCILI